MRKTGDAMTDADRLKDKLAKLGVPAQSAGGRRQLTAADATDFLRAALVEIDETVLARKLTFHNEDASITFEVANRRLHRLTNASPGFSSSTEALIGKQFSETGEDLIPLLATLLGDFFAASKKIHISTSRLQDELDPGNVGCAADVIAAANDLALYKDKPPVTDDRTNSFIDQCSGIAEAWVRFDASGVRTSGGNESTIQRITTLAESSFTGFDKQMNRTFSSAGHCVIVGATDNGKQSVLYVNSGGQGAFMAIPTDRIAEAHKYWRQSQD